MGDISLLRWRHHHLHGFAEAILSLAKKYKLLVAKKVEPITSAEFPTPVQRRANSVLDCALIKKHFGICTRPWKESLTAMLEQLFSK